MVDVNKVVTLAGLKAKHDYDENTYLAKSSDTMTGTLILSNTNDALPTSYNNPALVVGGETEAAHLEIDANEILAKANETTPSNLFLNDDIDNAVDSDGNKVRVGISGSVDINNDGVMPRVAKDGTLKDIDIGAEDTPFNHMYSKNYNLYNNLNSTDYGALRIGKIDDYIPPLPAAVLELGDKNKSISGKITVHSINAFTNIFANSDEGRSTSNAVTLPTQSGSLALSKTGSYQGYVGAGIQGSPMSLTFEFEPNIIFIWRTHTTSSTTPTTDCVYGVLFRGGNGIYRDSSGTTKIIKTTWGVEGNARRVQWYTEETNALYGLSGAQNYYSYIAL